MRFRFLYLNEAGEEVEVGGVEELRACVAMGRVDENTLLYDSVTREWAPARAHSAYRILADEIAAPGDGDGWPTLSPPRGRAEEKPAAPPESVDLPELTPLLEPEVPDAVARFLEQQERNRRLEVDEPEPTPHGDFHVVERADELAERTAVPEPHPSPPPAHQHGEEARPDDPPPAEPFEVPVPRIRVAGPPRTISRSPVGRRRRRVAAVLGVALVIFVAWGVLQFGDGAEAGDLPTAPGIRPGPSVGQPDAITAVQGSAFRDMVTVMDSLRAVHDVVHGPAGWLDGHYLATASAYPHVEAYWRRYQRYVVELRARDTALFRAGFVRRLREEGLEGPVIQMRVARAVEEFRASQPVRDTLYQGMETLAARSLELHALLLERESDVEYDPVQLGSVSRDPVIEAFPSDPELREQIWGLLDGIFEAMDVVQGGVPGSRDQLSDAPLREILRSAERH
jgi:hypothetical protein